MIGVSSEPGTNDRTSIVNHDMKESSGIPPNQLMSISHMNCSGLCGVTIGLSWSEHLPAISFCHAKVGTSSAIVTIVASSPLSIVRKYTRENHSNVNSLRILQKWDSDCWNLRFQLIHPKWYPFPYCHSTGRPRQRSPSPKSPPTPAGAAQYKSSEHFIPHRIHGTLAYLTTWMVDFGW